jgi:hypothetical protein
MIFTPEAFTRARVAARTPPAPAGAVAFRSEQHSLDFGEGSVKLVKLSAAVVALSMAAGCAGIGGAAQPAPAEKKSDSKPAGGGQAAAAPDMRDYMQAMSPMFNWPKDASGMAVGTWVESKSTGPANSTTHYAIVEDAGDKLKIEMTGSSTQGYIEGLVVAKADGKVVEAWAGKKGEKPKKIKIMEMAVQKSDAPPTTDEDCTVAAGTFKCKKCDIKLPNGTMTTWAGCEGDGDCVSVKVKSADGKSDYELKALAMEDMTAAGKPMKAKHASYSNGMEMWLVDAHPPLLTSGVGLCPVKLIASGMTTELNWGDGAKPEMDWANAK